ncbi:NADP-dependent oxidoreductase [Mycobacterium vicinigordonae]|uniref:NADP-dependent oxidoreductase n=2 Tax=Mycobacterium vicinigordonae TaxID=1719132 RepID=A0A7D6I570_9MYCO|nr:NADP-dependent oxidoreductase [Mycobacterium vicinigordonae]
MMAAQAHQPGGPEVLQWEAVDRPVPTDGEVLLRVRAAGVNPPDWYMRSGFSGLPRELTPPMTFPFIPGWDVAGEVVDTGPGVTGWRLGDRAFGLVGFPTSSRGGGQTYAQFAVAPANELTRIPAGLDDTVAGGLPMAALTAYQFVVDHAGLSGRERVMVVGAAGGVGHLIVQLAKLRGAFVIAVASGRHASFLAELGADEFIDYTRSTVSEQVHDVDVVFDTVGGPDGHRLLPALRDGGVLCPVFFGDYHPREAARRGIEQRFGQVRSDSATLAHLAELVSTQQLRVAIDHTYPLADAAEAHRRAEQGHLQGKLVLTAHQ